MPRKDEEEEESKLYAGRGGDPNGKLNPEVSQLLEAVIRDGNAVRERALRLFCEHVLQTFIKKLKKNAKRFQEIC